MPVSDSGSSGIFVLEGAPAGDPIPISRETIAAFVGPAPRGPVSIPVAVRSVAEYLSRFGSPDKPSRLEQQLSAYFDNGGSLAIVVRVCRSGERNRLRLPAGPDLLVLEALHPGPLELLRASIDYDQVAADELDLFNLVIHRLDSGSRGHVAEQEIFRRVSADPAHPDFVGNALFRSGLVRLLGDGPGRRPDATIGPGASGDAWIQVDQPRAGAPALSDYELIGSVSEGTGLYSLEQVPCIDLLCVLSPSPVEALGPVAILAAERYCRRRNAMLLLPPPPQCDSVSRLLTHYAGLGLTSPNIITWFPELATGSAAGAIAGVLVAGDARGEPPAATCSLRGTVRPAQRLTLMESAALQRAGINALGSAGANRLVFSGGVNLGRAAGLPPEWHALRYRRAALRVLGAVARASRWALFLANEPETLADLHAQLANFLSAQREAGLLVGERDEQAWFLECLAPADDLPLRIHLGIALRRAGEFQAFRITHTPGDCRIRELGWQPALALAS